MQNLAELEEIKARFSEERPRGDVAEFCRGSGLGGEGVGSPRQRQAVGHRLSLEMSSQSLFSQNSFQVPKKNCRVSGTKRQSAQRGICYPFSSLRSFEQKRNLKPKTNSISL